MEERRYLLFRFLLFSILGIIIYDPVNNIFLNYLGYFSNNNSDVTLQKSNEGGLIHFLMLNDFFEILLLIVLLFYLFVEILFFRNSKNPDSFRLRFFAIIEGLFVFAVISLIFSSFLFISKLDKNSFFQTWDFLIVIFSCFFYFYLFSVSMTGFILKTFYSAEWVDFIREDGEKRERRS